jgi:hypothetical protein
MRGQLVEPGGRWHITALWYVGLTLALCSDGHTQAVATVARIGEVMGAPEYTFGLVSGAHFGPNEEVFILDSRENVVRVYDAAGRHIRSFGRAGRGPGEFERATRLVVTQSEVWVTDAVLRRLVRFTLDGTHVATSRYADETSGFDYVLPIRHGIAIASNENDLSIRNLAASPLRAPARLRESRLRTAEAAPFWLSRCGMAQRLTRSARLIAAQSCTRP